MSLNRALEAVLDALFFATVVAALVWAPYSKVEESFNLHAIYDSLVIGLDHVTDFDHYSFPGVVKRTCVGAIAVALPQMYLETSMNRVGGVLCRLRGIMATFIKSPQMAHDVCEATDVGMLLGARFVLALYVFLALLYFKGAIKQVTYTKSPNGRLALLWQLMTYSLPHVVFYVSRTLPNVMALPTALIGMGLFVKGDLPKALMMLAATGVLFRFEVFVFTIILAAMAWLNRLGELRVIVLNCVIGTAMGAYLSYQLDGYFWGEATIPELESFYYNVVEGQSANWGVEPVWAYVFKYLPRIFVANGFVTPVALLVFAIGSALNPKWKHRLDRVNYDIGTITVLVWTALAFVVVLSFNGHKEWRFLLFTLPVMTLGGASMMDYIFETYPVLTTLILVACFALGLVNTLGFVYISSWNYASGDLVQRLNMRVLEEGPQLGGVSVHWDVGTCSNGANNFLHLHSDKIDQIGVIYDKEESPNLNGAQFKYWVQYKDDKLPTVPMGCEWALVDIQEGLVGVNLDVRTSFEAGKRAALANNWHWPLRLLETVPQRAPIARLYEQTCLL